ncbi:RNA polymerase sigma factor [Fibrella aquatica]|jgi:RNA polymerase sigma factor (sigma-70 family)|uniref:RNA polymerase sigma factor n=1 Tax=Fibrella aquatica TaxID=3242487 RepID=UPI00351FFAE4
MVTNFKDEFVLTEQLRRRDERAFRWLYNRYSASLAWQIQKVIHDHDQAEDLLQDVFVKIWQHIDRYDASKGRLYTWMCNVARHTAIDAGRASTTRSRPATSHLLPIDEQTTYLIDQVSRLPPINTDRIGVKSLLATLSPQHQQLVTLLYFRGYTQQEAADELFLPVGTVKTRLRSALRGLRQLF